MNENKSHSVKKRRSEKTGRHWQWVLRVFLLSTALSAILSFGSSAALENSGYLTAILVLIFFILVGIVFDMIGVSVTAADPAPFHSMASHRTPGAKEALFLLSRAEKVSSFCNDVVGDICGIVSGATAAVIVVELQSAFSLSGIGISILLTALISGLTIGGKAAGKKAAIHNAKAVVTLVARVMHFFHIGR